jgi:RNA polymerase sigma-70 factor (ECF subfamily)
VNQTTTERADPTTCDFAQIVAQYYEPLYRFAFSLTRAEPDAKDLTQQTFYIWAAKGHQLRDVSKVKTWLFTALRREFLNIRKKCSRLDYSELSDEDQNIACVSPDLVNSLDAVRVVELLQHVNEPYRSAVALFYMEDFSYQEMVGILEVPIGTVQSRISRGVGKLQRLMFREGGMGQRPLLAGTGTAECGSGISPGTCTASKLTTYEKPDATIARQDRGREAFHNLACKVRL